MSADAGRTAIHVGAAVALFTTALVVFVPSLSNAFLDFDDAVYVTENPQIQAGFTRESVAWAFTSGQGANWFPLTRFSHMLDVELFGDDPRGHHATSVLLHALNSALVYFVFARLTGARATSFALGLLFAVHPLHVESVSWVSSRKDVLSGLFWLLGMAAYLAYVKRPGPARYPVVIALYIAAVMAKPVAITFPVVLLLLDFWPLARLQQGGGLIGRREFIASVLEKLPVFGLAVVFSAIAVFAQRTGGTMEEMAGVGLLSRVNNALVAYVRYIGHTIWPVDLMFPYAHLGNARPLWHGAIAAAVLATITALAWVVRRQAPSVIVGWLWFLVMLLPTIGLIQVGTQAMADRYMYLPILGLFLMIVWPAARHPRDVASRTRNDTSPFPAESVFRAVVVCVWAVLIFTSIVYAWVTWQQQRFWRDSESLLWHAVAVQPSNVPARVQLAVVFLREGEPARAEEQLREALAHDPLSVPAWSNFGSALRAQGRPDESVNAYRRALEIAPGEYAPSLNLATLLIELGRTDEATPILESIIGHPKETAVCYLALAQIYFREGRDADAIGVVRDGLNRFPDDPSLQLAANQLRRLRF